MDEFKPTNRKPLGIGGKTLEKEFNPHLTEVDSMLNEKEQSFKKKVWNLSKMESLVFSDPKLKAKYDDMSDDGQEKYGYHYNETIMNMLFNDYVTNDSGYRQKYLNAIPDKKERRDKSGINQLQQKGVEKMQKKGVSSEGEVHNNSLAGVIEEDGMMDNNLNHEGGGTFDDRDYLTHRINKKYDTTPNTMEENDINKSNVQRTNRNFSDKSASQANSDAINDTDPLSADDVRKYDSGNKTYDTMSVDGDEEYVENQYENEIKETTGAASSGAFSTALGAKNNVYEGDEQIDETTTSASSGAYEGPFRKKGKDNVTNKPAWAGGEIIGENYLVNANIFKNIYNELNEGMNSPNDMSRVPIAEFDMMDDKQVLKNTLRQTMTSMENLLSTKSANWESAYVQLKQQAERITKELGIPFKDPAQKGIFGKFKSAIGIGEGEVNEDGLGDSMNNLMGGINSKEEKINQIIQKGKNKFGDFNMLSHLPDTDIDRILQQVMGNQTAINPIGEGENTIKEDHLKGRDEKIVYIKDAIYSLHGGVTPPDFTKLSDNNINKLYLDYENKLGEGIISGTEGSVIGDNPTTMANTMKDVQGSSSDMNENGAPQNKDLSKYNSMTESEEILDEEGRCRRDEKPVAGVLAGEVGSCEKKDKKSKTEKSTDNKFNVKFRHKKEKERENKIEKKHTDYKRELEQNRNHMNKLKEMVEGTGTLSEDKRPSALVQMDRLHKDNVKNFKADVKNSNSTELASDQDKLTAGEQIEEVPENAYELAEKIEKDKMKQHEFNTLKNEGNSTNDDNKSIPKRNATDDEAEDIMLNRGLGMQDIVYDNKPDERFEERMKKDMGEQIYDQRQEKMKFRAKAPMYNKDTQPIEKGTEETQFDKNISKFNNPKGVKENHIVAAKFTDDMNNKRFVNFNVNEAPVKLVPEGTKLILEGMGNTYTQDVNENVDMRNMMDSWNFYINAGKVTKVAKGKQTLTEGDKKKSINEQLEKMKKLWNYKPEKHMSTANVKKNRNF